MKSFSGYITTQDPINFSPVTRWVAWCWHFEDKNEVMVAQKPAKKATVSHKPKREIVEVPDIIAQFAAMPARERVEMHQLLGEAVNRDREALSQGREPGNDHYFELTKD